MFSLIYLDEDDISEWVILDRTWDKYSLYTVRNGNAECLADSMTTVEMTCYKHKNIFAAFSRAKGGGDEGEYASAYYQRKSTRQPIIEYLPILIFRRWMIQVVFQKAENAFQRMKC